MTKREFKALENNSAIIEAFVKNELEHKANDPGEGFSYCSYGDFKIDEISFEYMIIYGITLGFSSERISKPYNMIMRVNGQQKINANSFLEKLEANF